MPVIEKEDAEEEERVEVTNMKEYRVSEVKESPAEDSLSNLTLSVTKAKRINEQAVDEDEKSTGDTDENYRDKYSVNPVINGIFEGLLYDIDHPEEFELKKEDPKNGVKLYMKTYKQGPMKEYPRYKIEIERAVGVFPSQIMDMLLHMDKQPDWNKHCRSCKSLGKMEDTEVSFTQLKIPFPLSDRGFLERRLDVKIKGTHYVMLTSAETQDIPLPSKKVTMGYTFVSAYIIKPVL